MMATYNLTLLSEANTILGLFEYANGHATGDQNVFMSLMMIAVYIIMLLALKKWSFAHGFLATNFVCTILSLFLVYADLLNFMFPLYFIVATAFTALIVFTTEN